MATKFYTGDSRPYTVALTINGAAFDIPAGATVSAAIVDQSKTTVLAAAVSCIRTYPGADWAESQVVVKFPRASTSGIAIQGKAWLEVQVTFDNPDALLDDDDWTWHIPIELVRGNIA